MALAIYLYCTFDNFLYLFEMQGLIDAEAGLELCSPSVLLYFLDLCVVILLFIECLFADP